MFKHKTNKTKGITLIALVVTIIVLLILAGISIMMLTGNNGILQRASDAKGETEISQIKEQAELIKGSAYINKKYNNKDLTKSDLLSEIANDKYFDGSKNLKTSIITANDKYKIEVDDDLNITVTEFKNEIEITCSVTNLAYGAIITITPTNITIPEYEEYKEGLLNNIKTDDDLKEIFTNYYKINGYELSWEQIYGERSFLEVLNLETIDDAKAWLENTKDTENKTIFESLYEKEASCVTVFLNGEKRFIGQNESASFFINKNQEYDIYVNAFNGSEGYTTRNVTEINNILTIKKAITMNDKIYILTADNKFVAISNPEFDGTLQLYKICAGSNFTTIQEDVKDFSYYVIPRPAGNISAPKANLFIINNNNDVFKMEYINEQENFDTKVNENVLQIEGMASIIDYYTVQHNMYYIYNNEPNSIYKDTTLIAENVKKFFYDYTNPYYITQNNELYKIDYKRKTYEINKISENVKEVNYNHYLTIDNKLYKENTEIAVNNVKDIGCKLYMTNNNEIYEIPFTTGDNNYNNKININIEIKELNKDYLITKDNLIYVDETISSSY